MSAAGIFAALDPSCGVARRTSVAAPSADNPLWTVAVDIGRLGASADVELGWVGAAGLSRARTMPRAAGEAVERYALLPGGRMLPSGDGLVDPWHGDEPTYAGTRAGAPVAVPASLVDYPTRGRGVGDPTPSGAAAGFGIDRAVRSAARELVERDAAMRAWYGDGRFERVDPDGLATSRATRGLMAVLGRLGCGVVVAALPSSGTAPRTMLAMVTGDEPAYAAFGVAVDSDEAEAAAKALSEAIQVRTVLLSIDPGAPTVPDPVRDDSGRALFWRGRTGRGAAERWRARLDRSTELLPWDGREVDWAAAVGDCAVVDLSPRIPEALLAHGWSAAKVVPLDLWPCGWTRRDTASHVQAPTRTR